MKSIKRRITVLVNNWTNESSFLAEHGLSLLIEDCHSERIWSYLFDTGQRPEVLISNADQIGVDWLNLRAVMFSHGHYDHTGGLLGILKKLKKPVSIYYHPEAFSPRINKKRDSRNIGIPFTEASLKESGNKLVSTRSEVRLTEDIVLTGEIPRIYAIESESTAGFYREKDGEPVKDEVIDDRSLIIRYPGRGFYLICGCCHAGLLNTLEYAGKVYKNEQVLGIIGGFHMHGAGEERMRLTVDKLKEYNPSLIVPMHCTGRRESAVLYNEFKGKVKFAGVGEIIEL